MYLYLNMSSQYFNDYNNIKNPIVILREKNHSTIFEWIEYVSYFRKMCDFIDFFILKCSIRDYYIEDTISARSLLRKIMENLNFYIYDIIHYEYFLSFDESIKRFKNLKYIICEGNGLVSDFKKHKFLDYLLNSLNYIQLIVVIFERNLLHPSNNLLPSIFTFLNTISEIKFLPFAGGNNGYNFIKSFWVTQSCVTNNQYLYFIQNSGYIKKSYWSQDGYYWLKATKSLKPKNWSQIGDKWFINNIPIDDLYNHPVEKINYYEAEACCNFYKCRLPTEEEWIWMSTNRNKTEHPNGIDCPFFFELAVNFSCVESVLDRKFESLMGLYQLYGNVWEFTQSMVVEDNETKICTKGGDWKVPNFVLNKNLKMFVKKFDSDNSIGFRMIHN